jgi:putative PEP-CTERM system histidine kinase
VLVVAAASGAAGERVAVALFFLLPFAAGFFSLLLAVVGLLRRKRSVAAWCFSAGMVALGLDSIFTGLSLRATQLGEAVEWLAPALLAKSFVPVIWLGCSLTYSRSNYREFLVHWKIPLAFLGLLPIGLSLGYLERLASPGTPGDLWWLQSGVMAKTLNVILLIALVSILVNLEQTFRSAVGTMRWRIKFVVVALAVIFGARLYVRSQAILFSAPDIALWSIESGALLIGCIFLALAYARTGLAEIDVHPSLAVLRSSGTVLIVGGYLLVVGVLAQVVTRFGGAEIFQFQAVVVILGMAGLAVLLLSDRARQRMHVFVARHFRKAQHDSVRIWTLFSRRLARVKDQAGLCAVSVKLISETFDVLSVTIWLLDEEKGSLIVRASTAGHASDAGRTGPTDTASSAVTAGLRATLSPFDLEDIDEAWAEELRRLNSTAFPNGGKRLCVPLLAGEQILGVVVLADRVNGAVYTVEELDLLKCIGDQMTSVLLNLRLATEVASAKELEAFRTMSAFFVHDLKNAASSLNLMLKNLPVHFDDPAFREDALRGVGNTARRIDDMIVRLTALRQRPDSIRVESDLNQLVSEALDRINGMPNVELTRELQPLPAILADREMVQSVVTNLVLNARDALGSGGRIQVRTEHQGARVVLSVVDNGCGMSQAFLNDSLFRPFQSTKKKGLGIGLFQSRAIVQAHGGGMHVESEAGAGTTFLVSFPVNDAK